MAVTRILEQWHELKTHFGIAAKEEKCHKAIVLYNMFQDNINYLYLLFLKPILQDMQKVNKCFQSNTSNPSKLLNELIFAINSLKIYIIAPDKSVDCINDDGFEKYVTRDLYLGYAFEKHIKSVSISNDEEKSIRESCTNFVVDLVKQLKQRLPDNFKILKQADAFAVENILKTKKKNIIPILEFFGIPNIDEIERQYNELTLISWENTEDTIKFWVEVLNYRDSGGNNRFSKLSSVALEIHSLPWSNAEVERVFSQVNLIKNKIRNRMNVDTLNSILTIRSGLSRHNKCCFDYKVSSICLKSIENVEQLDNEPKQSVDNLIAGLMSFK
ncbi:uncharacterized protein LOC124462142 [Drosophila willistoni]|uniref:uncharacterized protein LOC124462142 n=1 Tax=Drosophila willistoni TaxID=7260 RepID=UPI001F085D10|nr:uncharacterized protein LOC124462142 [Drosophila willistoni]